MKTAITLLLFVVLGCKSEERAARQGGVPNPAVPSAASRAFSYAINGEPETLDPAKLRGVPEASIAIQVFEGLLEYPKGEGAMQPGVAERWELSPDGRTYTFHLRADAKWSNGDPVTAEDFRWSWLRVLDKQTGSSYAETMFIIDGAKAFMESATPDVSTVGLRVVDRLTLSVKLSHVAPYFLELCGFHTFRPVHRATVENFGDHWTRPGNIVANGPFLPSDWVSNKHLELRRNEKYWDVRHVALETIRVLPVQENSTAVNLFDAGQIDWTGTVDLPAIGFAQLQTRPDYREDAYLGTYFYRINVTREPFKDVRVRRALSLSIDRESIVKVIKGGNLTATTFVPKMAGFTSADAPHLYDPREAKRLLSEAGFPDGKGFPRFALLYNTEQNHKRVAEMMQQMWQRDLGISVDLINQEWKVYLQAQEHLDYDLSRSGWVADYQDPIAFLELFTTGNGNNNTGFGDKEYDTAVDQVRTSADPVARAVLLTRLESILLSRGPIIPIYFYGRPYLLNRQVRGFEPHLLDLHPFKYLSFETTPPVSPPKETP